MVKQETIQKFSLVLMFFLGKTVNNKSFQGTKQWTTGSRDKKINYESFVALLVNVLDRSS